MTTQMTGESMARELAELTVDGPNGKRVFPDGTKQVTAIPVLDPRFASLRCYHPEIPDFELLDVPWHCHQCNTDILRRDGASWSLRTDLGAIVRAAAACGYPSVDVQAGDNGLWACTLLPPFDPNGDIPEDEWDTQSVEIWGAHSPEEAAMKALYTAVTTPR